MMRLLGLNVVSIEFSPKKRLVPIGGIEASRGHN